MFKHPMSLERRVRVAGLFVACAAVGSIPALAANNRFDPKNPPQGFFFDEWYAVTLADTPCGYMHSTLRRDGDEILSLADTKITLQRDRASISIGMTQTYRETLDGRPLAFEQITNLAGQPIKLRGKVAGRKIKLTTEQFGAKQVRTTDFDPEVRFAWGQFLDEQHHGLAPGTTYDIKTFEPSLTADQVLLTTTSVIGPQDVQLLGRKVRGIKVRSTIQTTPPIVSDGWVDSDGMPLVMELNLGAIKVRVLRSDRRTATRVEQLPELFLSTFVKADGPVDRRVHRLVLRVSVSGDALPDLPETAMQHFKRTSQRSGELTIERSDWRHVRMAGRDPPQEYLARSTYLDVNDPLIVELAEKARGESDGVELADRLRRFVTRYIHKKDLGVGFASASEVAKSREGDCTEHSVLLAALARVNKLPARVVAGLLLVPGSRDEFGYHMWTQVWLNGQWVDLDAAMDQTECDATHIALSTLSLSDDNALSAVVGLTSILGRLKIEVVDGGR